MLSTTNNSKRQAIIKAATRMFLAHGYRKSSMEKIALTAPVSKATLYNHFDSKKALLAGVVAELCESLSKTIALTATDEENIEGTLNRIAASFVELLFSEDALGIYRLVIAESRDFPKMSHLFYTSGPQALWKQLEDYLYQLNSYGRFHGADPAFSADAFFSLLMSDLHLQCLLGIRPLPSASEKNKLIAQVVSFYMRGMHDTT